MQHSLVHDDYKMWGGLCQCRLLRLTCNWIGVGLQTGFREKSTYPFLTRAIDKIDILDIIGPIN
jgi:hypothetical protein